MKRIALLALATTAALGAQAQPQFAPGQAAPSFVDRARVQDVSPSTRWCRCRARSAPASRCRTRRRWCSGRSGGYGGAVIGGVAGGLLGNQVGKGHGREAATAVGAVIGAITGNSIAEQRQRCRSK